jgi:hypothetical protein
MPASDKLLANFWYSKPNLKISQLGITSKPFKAKFPGVCKLSGIKIKVGDNLVYYADLPNGPCHVSVVNLHIWFPWNLGHLQPEVKIRLMEQIEKERWKNEVEN